MILSCWQLRSPLKLMRLLRAIPSGTLRDRDLLVLAEYRGIKIMVAKDFLQQYFDIGS